METFDPALRAAVVGRRQPVIFCARALGVIAGCAAGLVLGVALLPLVIAACLALPPLLCLRYAAHRHHERHAPVRGRDPSGASLRFRGWSEGRS